MEGLEAEHCQKEVEGFQKEMEGLWDLSIMPKEGVGTLEADHLIRGR